MNRNPAHLSHDERRDVSIVLTIVFLIGACITLVLTLGGVHALLQLVSAATSFKASVVASVLGLGMVVLGPVLLLALAVILPRWWLRESKSRIRRLFHRRDS